ncbi:MAG TPA: PIN-like domain-containing protein [Candidatus Paceibacterota bacterium]
MKKDFPEYYPLTKLQKEKLWDSAIFVFDASLLLDLYCYSENTRNDFLDILEKMSSQIWLPHQFAYEYQKNRLKIIQQQKRAYADIRQKLQSNFEFTLKNIKDRHPFLNIDNIIKKIKAGIDDAIKEINDAEKKHPNWSSNDTVRRRLDIIFKDKIGEPCKDIEEMERQGAKRNSREVPPGFEDQKKDRNKYGDWFGWHQIMEMAEKNKKSIVLVTSEKKRDWWLKIEDEIIEPLPELRKEISIRGAQFHMYDMETFLQAAKAKKSTLKEIQEINKTVKNLGTSDTETDSQLNDHAITQMGIGSIEAGEQTET